MTGEYPVVPDKPEYSLQKAERLRIVSDLAQIVKDEHLGYYDLIYQHKPPIALLLAKNPQEWQMIWEEKQMTKEEFLLELEQDYIYYTELKQTRKFFSIVELACRDNHFTQLDFSQFQPSYALDYEAKTYTIFSSLNLSFDNIRLNAHQQAIKKFITLITGNELFIHLRRDLAEMVSQTSLEPFGKISSEFISYEVPIHIRNLTLTYRYLLEETVPHSIGLNIYSI